MECRRGERPNYLDRDGLARYFPIDWMLGSDALTAYLVQVADDAGRAWPQETLQRMLSGLEAFATGRITRGSPLPTADLTVRKLAAIDALPSRPREGGHARYDRHRSALWPTSALIDWIGILKRVEKLPQRDERLKEAFNLLRSRLNFQGTVMTFATERTDALWWLMISADVNANRALLAVLAEPGSARRGAYGTWIVVAAEARALGHHDRKCVEDGSHRTLRAGLREDAGDRQHRDRDRR